MPKETQIRTKNVRRELFDISAKVVAGTLDPKSASTAIKALGQINENIHAESRIARIRIDAGQQADEFGELTIA